MSEQTLESGQEPVDSGVPTPTFTEVSADSKVSTNDPGAIARQVMELIRPEIERVAQSTKDRRFDKIEKAMGLSELESLGATIPENVKQEMRFRELENKLSQPQQTQTPSRQGGDVSATEWSRVIEEAGLDLKSPDTIQLLRGQYRNLDHFSAEAFRLKSRLEKSPNPNPATQSSITSRETSSGSRTITQVTIELASLQNNPSKENKARRAELNAELKALQAT